MTQTNDPELERIQQRKIAEMLKRVLDTETQTGKPLTLTDENFTSEIRKHSLIVVDFWAPWCSPCRMVSPIIEQLASEYAGKVAFGKMNVDENMSVPGHFSIRSIPTLMVFKRDVAVETIVGACQKSFIEAKFKPHMGNQP
jgi:thioredoxin 1